MDPNLELRRKWTFRAHGRQMIFIKKTMESSLHVWTKALIWALFLTDYPDLSVEPPMELRYKPDLVQLDEENRPVFWGKPVGSVISYSKALVTIRQSLLIYPDTSILARVLDLDILNINVTLFNL